MGTHEIKSGMTSPETCSLEDPPFDPRMNPPGQHDPVPPPTAAVYPRTAALIQRNCDLEQALKEKDQELNELKLEREKEKEKAHENLAAANKFKEAYLYLHKNYSNLNKAYLNCQRENEILSHKFCNCVDEKFEKIDCRTKFEKECKLLKQKRGETAKLHRKEVEKYKGLLRGRELDIGAREAQIQILEIDLKEAKTDLEKTRDSLREAQDDNAYLRVHVVAEQNRCKLYECRLEMEREKQEAPEGLEERDPNPELSCLVTRKTMKDPVVATDGHTYERTAIVERFQNHSTSPATNEDLGEKGKALLPNLTLRKAVQVDGGGS